jgi:hypothetical protein
MAYNYRQHAVYDPAWHVLGPPCPVPDCLPGATFPGGRPASAYYRYSGECALCYARDAERHNAEHQRRYPEAWQPEETTEGA